jgi:hypothetical protein
MQSPETTAARVSWTWADLVSTYRFWGLFITFVLAGSASSLHYTFVFERYRELGIASIGQLEGISRLFWVPLALVLAWVAVRTRPKLVLLIAAGFAAAAILVSLMPEFPVELGLVLESLLVPLLSALTFILFPALLAGACGAYQPMLIAFGVAWVFNSLVGSGLGALMGPNILERYGASAMGWVMFTLLLVVVVILIPIQRELFTVAPPERGRSLAPANRNPVVAAILTCFVPFYFVYWLYRIHGEEAYVKPSRKLLSPRAAAWICVIPGISELMIPFILSTLADHNNEVSESTGGGRAQRPWAAFLCGLLVVPVGVGLVQASLNKLAAKSATILAEPAVHAPA